MRDSTTNEPEWAPVLAAHCQRVVEELGSLGAKGIILCGGYGRGEGGWFRSEDGNLKPYNDYDLVLIVKKKVPQKTLVEKADALAREFDLRWVDIKQIYPWQLRVMRPTIFSFDLKFASEVLDGDSRLLELLPDIRAENLSLREGLTLFLTRLWTLLGAIENHSIEMSLSGESARFFRSQMAKAIFAVADTLLLERKSYHWSYKERVERVSTLSPEPSELNQLCRWALEERLEPRSPDMDGTAVAHLYRRVHHLFHREMYRFLSEYWRRSISAPEDVEEAMTSRPLAAMKRAMNLLGAGGARRERKLKLDLAQVYIAAAYTGDGVDPARLSRGAGLLREMDPTLAEGLTWDQARLVAAEMRLQRQ